MSTELNNELKELGSVLSQVEKTYFADNSQVPLGYFDGMEDRFLAKLKIEEAPREPRSISIFGSKRISYALAAVASFAILGIGLFTLVKQNNTYNLSQNEVVAFLEDEGLLSHNANYANATPVNLDNISKEEAIKFLVEEEGMDVTNIN